MKVLSVWGIGVLLAGTTLVAEAQIERVITLKQGLKVMLQQRGAKSLKKKEVKIGEQEAATLQSRYGFKPNKGYRIYTGLDADKQPIGSVVVADIEGKEGPLQLLVALEPDSGAVQNIAFTLFGEERGKPAMKKAFLGQFIGFKTGNAFKLGKDVDGITGATWTSESVVEGVKHAVSIYDHFVAQPAQKEGMTP